jgi:serine phosphatase RsbU (regulator of sigma subunit)
MSQLRNGVRACAFAGLDPSRSLGVLDRLLVEGAAELYATAVVMVYNPTTGIMRWSNAGHPPPIIAIPGRGARLLDAVHGSLLGVQADAPYAESAIDFPAGGVLVVYTDGLVERRGSDIQDALTHLVDAVGGLPLHRGVEALCDRVLAAAFADHNRRDDLCLLVAKRVPGGGP